MGDDEETRDAREIADHREGFEWLLGKAVDCDGSMRRMIGIQPLGKASKAWISGFHAALWVLFEILVPPTVSEQELEQFIVDHEPIPADDAAVRAFVLDQRDPAAVRKELWGDEG
jgi:hypothetical protein